MGYKLLPQVIALTTVLTMALSGSVVADHTQVKTGTLNVVQTGYVLATSHNWFIDLDAGDTISVELEWTKELTDLDVRVLAPGGSCALLPDTDLECLANSGTSRFECPDNNDGRKTFAAHPERITTTVEHPGSYTIAVQAVFAKPGEPVPYTLRVVVDNEDTEDTEHHPVTGPENISYASFNSYCRFV